MERQAAGKPGNTVARPKKRIREETACRNILVAGSTVFEASRILASLYNNKFYKPLNIEDNNT